MAAQLRVQHLPMYDVLGQPLLQDLVLGRLSFDMVAITTLFLTTFNTLLMLSIVLFSPGQLQVTLLRPDYFPYHSAYFEVVGL